MGGRGKESGWLLGGGTAPGGTGQRAGLGAQLNLGRSGASRGVSWRPVLPAAQGSACQLACNTPPTTPPSPAGAGSAQTPQAAGLDPPARVPAPGGGLRVHSAALRPARPLAMGRGAHIFSPTALCILKTIYAHRRSFSAGGCQSLFLFCPSGLSAAGRLSLPILQRRRLRLRAGGGWHCS